TLVMSSEPIHAGQPTPIQVLMDERAALLPEIERLLTEADLADGRCCAATPPVPEELQTNFVHAHMNGLKDYLREGRGVSGEEVEWIPVDGWRHRVEQPLCPAELGPLAEYMMVTHDRARAREVLPIAERYEAACQAAREATGVDLANAAWEAADF